MTVFLDCLLVVAPDICIVCGACGRIAHPAWKRGKQRAPCSNRSLLRAPLPCLKFAPPAHPYQSVTWSTPRKDAREQSSDLRKAEIFINNRGGGDAGAGGGRFCCFEVYRCAAC